MARIRGPQIATGADGIATDNIVDLAVTPAKALLSTTWTFTAVPQSTVAPSSANDLVNKTYADSLAAGLDPKGSVRAATTANITLSGAQTIDGVSVIAGNRVLVRAQTAGADNGIYVAAAGAWSRSTDADTSAEVTAGLFTFVEEGTLYGDTGWVLSTDNPITLGTTSLSFVQFSSAGVIVAGAGLTKTGNTIDVVAANTSIVVAADSIAVGFGTAGQMVADTGGDTALAAGTLDYAARIDHTHSIDAALAGSITPLGDTAAAGTENSLARGDHRHPRDVERQELLTAQAITSTDTALTDTLDFTPINSASLQLYQNGVMQEQGALRDYTFDGINTITWLASSGTAANMKTTDRIIAKYVYEP